MKRLSMSYRIMFVIAIVAMMISIYIFRNSIRKSLIETLGSRRDDDGDGYERIDHEKINRECQTAYFDSLRAVLTGPSVDPKNGYVSDKDALTKVNAVGNTCRWNNKTPIEKKYQKFRTVLSDSSDKNQINHLLMAIS